VFPEEDPARLGVTLKFCPECFQEFPDEVPQCPADGSVLSGVQPDPLVGTKLSERYQIQSVLGRGGMGVVYKACHEHLDRIVAIKMLHRHLVSEEEALKRFHREAKAVSRVKHPNSVRLYDFGISPTGQPYIVMDYIEGISLKRVLKESGPLPIERAGHIFGQVVEALSCAHAEGVIHRDLKPENIMLTKRGNDSDWVEVVDFGISKLRSKDNQTIDNITRFGDVCGSPPYMSPEQCLASVPVDARSDIYSLGVVLFETLAGRLPYKGKTAVEMIDCHLYAIPTPLKAANPDLGACEALSNLLSRALQKEPEKRHQDMNEFGLELKEAVKRDAVKLRSILTLAQAISEEAMPMAGELAAESAATAVKPLEAPAMEVDRARRSGKTTSASYQAISAQVPAVKGGFLTSIWRFIFGRGKAGDDGPVYILANCPYCDALLKPKIRFCLDCGRMLPSPKELSRLRAAQGVFSYPKGQKAIIEHPEFSTKARAVSSRRTIPNNKRALLAFNIFLVLILCWFLYAAWVDKQVPIGMKGPGPTSKPHMKKPAAKTKPTHHPSKSH